MDNGWFSHLPFEGSSSKAAALLFWRDFAPGVEGIGDALGQLNNYSYYMLWYHIVFDANNVETLFNLTVIVIDHAHMLHV